MRRNRREAKRKAPKGVAPGQREVLRGLMLVTGGREAWLTLRELARLTRYGEASISAQLRNLRKPEYGAFVVEKRRREAGEAVRGGEFGAVWEYRLIRRSRAQSSRRARRSGPARAKLSATGGKAEGL